MLCVFVCLSVSMHRRILYPSAIPKRLYSVSRTSSSCHYLFFPKKQIEPWKAERRIASCNAAGKDLCHPVPRRSLFIYLSVFVFSLQLPPSLPHYLFLCTLAVVQRDKSSEQSSFIRNGQLF